MDGAGHARPVRLLLGGTAGNAEWRCPGECALLFLSRSTQKPGGFYITNHSQSAYVLDGVTRSAPRFASNSETPSSGALKACH